MTTVCSEECRVQTLSAGRAREQKRSIPIQQQCPPQQRYIPQTALTAATTTTKTTTTTTRENFHDKYPCIVLVYYSLQHVFIPLQYLSMCVCFFFTFARFSLAPVGRLSRSRLRGTKGTNLYTTAQVWVPGGLRGACSGRSKTRNLASITGLLSAELEPSNAMKNPHMSCFAPLL